MGPVRVKYLGLLRMTRRTYLLLQFIALLASIAMMVVGLAVMLRTGVYFPHLPAMNVEDDLIYQLLLSLFWLGLFVLFAEGIETMVMLRKFARAEAAQKAQLADLEAIEPAPSASSSTAVQLPPNERPNTNIQP
jgi:high-affinity K+ transport system ATPase subunit B